MKKCYTYNNEKGMVGEAMLDRLNRSLQWKAATVLITVILIFTILTTLITGYVGYRLIVSYMGNHALHIAKQAAKDVDLKLVEQILKSGDPNTDGYIGLQRSLNEVREHHGAQYLYLMVQENEHEFSFVVDGLPMDDPNLSEFGDTEKASESMLRAMGGKEVIGEVAQTHWGKLISSYIPLIGENGKVIGILGVDYPADEIYCMLQKFFMIILGSSLGVIAVGSFISIRLSNYILRPMVKVIGGTKHLGEGDLSYRIYTELQDEFGEIADSFNTMAAALEKEILTHKELEEEIMAQNEELQESYMKLMEIDHLKDEFVSNVSHELRTPLTSINSFAEILYDDLEDLPPAQQRKYLQIILGESRRLEEMINNVLDLSKLESGKMDWHMEQGSITEDILYVKELMEKSAEKKNVQIEAVLEETLHMVSYDSSKIRQVLINMVGNAIKFMDKEPGIIQMRSCETEEGLLVSVQDNGMGIPEDAIEWIFDRFKQVDSSATRKRGGTGLGMAICKEIIEHHGGKIGVHSELGIGTTFYFILPTHRNL